MIIENSQIEGLKSELAHLDEVTTELGFVRWQWEYYRAVYEIKIVDNKNNDEYFLRINTRVVEGKLEKPDTVLVVEHVYIGKGTFPHGLDYDILIPQQIQAIADQKLAQLKSKLS